MNAGATDKLGFNNGLHSPYGFSPCWLCITIPHEAPNEGPDSGYEQCDRDEKRGCNHNGSHKDAQKIDVHVCDQCAQEGDYGK